MSAEGGGTAGTGSVSLRGGSSCGVKNEVKRDAFPPVFGLATPSFFDSIVEAGASSSVGVAHMPKNLSGPVSIAKGVSTFGCSRLKNDPTASDLGGISSAGVLAEDLFIESFHF